MGAAPVINDDVQDVVEHVRKMASDHGFDINPDNAEDAVEESAYMLGIALDRNQVHEAVTILVN